MSPENLADLKRLLGDLMIARDDLMNICSRVEDKRMDDDEVLFFARKIITKCDTVSGGLETIFANGLMNRTEEEKEG